MAGAVNFRKTTQNEKEILAKAIKVLIKIGRFKI